MGTYSSILAWKIQRAEEASKLQSMWHKETDKTEWLSTHTEDIWRDRVSSQKIHGEKGLWELVESLEASVQFSHSVMSDSLRPHGLQHDSFLSITNSQSLLKLMSIKSVMPSNHLILCRPLLLLPSVFPSIRVFSNESALHTRWPKYWSFSFNISPSNEHQDWSPLGWTG